MKVRDFMVTDLVTAAPWEVMAEVARKMRDYKIGCVLITHDGQLLGLVTDRKITVQGIADGLDPQTTRIEEIMTRDLHTISPDADVVEATRLFGQYRIRRLPVVGDGQRLLGIISLADVAADLKSSFDGVFQELAAWRREGKGYAFAA